VTIYSILSALLRLIGFARWADACWRAHEMTVKAQEVADAPTTKAELEETLRDGKL
jgi:hypothetical protein